MGWRVGITASVIFFLIMTFIPSGPVATASGDLKAEGEEGFWSATTIKEVFFKPTDDDIPPDRRYDLYEDRPQDWVFTFQVLEWDMNGTTGDPVPSGIVWLNITMGAYTNSTRSITDIRGRVHFSFSSRFKDTETGSNFMFADYFQNLTIQIKFIGNERYTESSRTYFCTYHRMVPREVEVNSYPCFSFGSLLTILIIAPLLTFQENCFYRRKRN